MLGGQLAIGATNELVDLPYDTVGKPWKPLPSGDVSIRGARIMVVVGLIMMVAFGWRFGTFAFALLAAGTGLGIATIFGSSAPSGRGCHISSPFPCCRSGFSRPWEDRSRDCCCSTRSGHWPRSACISPRRSPTWRSIARPGCRRRRVARSAAHLRRRLADDSFCAGVGLARRLVAGGRAALFRHRTCRRADAPIARHQRHPDCGRPARRDHRLLSLVALATLACALAWTLIVSS